MRVVKTSLLALGLVGCANYENARPMRYSGSYPAEAQYAYPQAQARAEEAPYIDEAEWIGASPQAPYTPVPSALAYYEKPSAIKVFDERKVALEEVVVWQSAGEAAAPTTTFKTVKVAKGDTLYSISKRHGAAVWEVAEANNLSAPFALRPGQDIRIPEGAVEAPASKEAVYFMPTLSAGTAFVEEPELKDVAVAKGDTLYSIARANNVPVKDLIEANNIKPPYSLSVGQRLNLPAAAFYVVKKGDTLYSISRKFGLNLKSLAEINKLREPFALADGQKIRLSAATVAAEGAVPPKPSEATKKNVIEVKNNKPVVVAVAAPPAPSRPVIKKPTATTMEEEVVVSGRPAPTLAMPSSSSGGRETLESEFEKPMPMTSDKFAWPVRGRVISAFGAKDGSNRNDGINISAPLGSAVGAAENGVVVYAGNELKGLGNLVIIRHDKGFMTIYAHNDRLAVKKGQSVFRGEKIAEVGRTGRVSTPQHHFEVRQRTKSIDPMKVLAKQ